MLLYWIFSLKTMRKPTKMARNGTRNDDSLVLIGSSGTFDLSLLKISPLLVMTSRLTCRSSVKFISKSLEFLYLFSDLIRTSYKGSENMFRIYEFHENRRRESHNFLTGVNKITFTRAQWRLLHPAHKESLRNVTVLGQWDYRLQYITLMPLNTHLFSIKIEGSSRCRRALDRTFYISPSTWHWILFSVSLFLYWLRFS